MLPCKIKLSSYHSYLFPSEVLPIVGEAMEQGLRDCCRSIRIGKILIQTDHDTDEAKVFYAKFPPDITRRQVLLLYPIMSTYLDSVLMGL